MGTIVEGPADASRAVDAFYESEAALQLVCSELDALRMDDAPHRGTHDAQACQQAALPAALPFIQRRQARWTRDPRALVSSRDVARSDRTDRDSRPVAPPADPSLAH